jgi:DNA processing protein
VLGVSSSGPIALPHPGPSAPSALRPPSPERDAWTVLAAVHGLGPVGLAALLARYGSGVAILAEATAPGGVTRLAATPGEQRVDGVGRRRPINAPLAEAIADVAHNASRTLARIRAEGIDVVTLEEPLYPHRLAAIALPPHLLFVRGDLNALDPARAVAVVGTRHPTTGGRRLAARIAGALARVEATVVSGLAVGIDGEAHEAALLAGGSTIAVIGSGHARLFPRGHTRLAERIVRSGGAVVSELAPDVEATPGTFPRRNRVIAGMSDATVVVEAPARSGALITASWALEEGRDAFLVPGGIGEPASAGCLSFLRDNQGAARIVAGVPQLLYDLGLIDHDAPAAVQTTADAESTLIELGGTAGRIGREIVAGRATVDELVAVTGLPVATVLGALTLLEDRGLVRDAYGRYRPVGALAVVESDRRRPVSAR